MKLKLNYLILILLVFSSCIKHEGGLMIYPAKEYLVASDRGCWAFEGEGWEPYYFVKEKGKNTWETFDRILGLEYELGHEYLIKAEKVVDKELLKIADAPSYIYLRLVKVLSIEEKDSEGLPDNYLPYSEELPPPSEYYKDRISPTLHEE
ncbi:MAG: DUF4377 domain-containing protein [Candidatus Cryptobacteroides sp.]